MMLSNLAKSFFKHYRVSCLKKKGITTKRHIVVFESDDWGSIRMPSLDARERLLRRGTSFQSPSSFDMFDTLASDADLTVLIEVLSGVKDRNGNPAILTLDTVVANPDFEKIKETGYSKYFYEPFTETLKRYPRHGHSFSLWKEGIELNVFRPQFHGREHLNVLLWMKNLRSGEHSTLAAFEESCFSMKCMIDGNLHRVLDAYNAQGEEDFSFMQQSVVEGLDLFEKIFGFRSESMIAPCYTWDAPIEEAAFRGGVKYLQGSVFNSHSAFYSQSIPHQTPRVMGEKNQFGQIHLVRNCSFEPSQDSRLGKDRCLRDIERQFKLHHPAIVSCHRLNFIGDLVPCNRDRNLLEFRELLKSIVAHWPDVEFMSSDQIGKTIADEA